MIQLMMRTKKRNIILGYSIITVLLLGVTSICVLSLMGCSQSDASGRAARHDIVTIDEMTAFGKLERTPVQFPHDLHIQSLKVQKKECTVCHLVMENGRLSSKYMRLKDTDKKAVMDIYHENCLTCHKEKAVAGTASGPVTCGECHRRKPLYQASHDSIGFDKSLHYRHLSAYNGHCAPCHHDFNADKESSCFDCHGVAESHEICVGCHIKDDNTGPTDCSSCHDKEKRLSIETVNNPPRLERGQPDFVLLSAHESELEASKLKTVPFSHISHEQFTTSCRVCHHQTLRPCNECHTLAGSDKSNGVTLQDAMHSMSSDHSCVGCHNKMKFTTECIGCHSLMEQGRLSEHACNICHAGPPPDRLDAVRAKYKSLDDFRPKRSKTRLSFATSEIPDSVSIGILSKKYEPVVMPHRRHVDRLMQNIKGSKIATHFHGHEDIICQGCHHNSPVGIKPPLCESCHGIHFDESVLAVPRLKEAYHQQCLGCHQNMNIKEPSDCVGCHAEKKPASGL